MRKETFMIRVSDVARTTLGWLQEQIEADSITETADCLSAFLSTPDGIRVFRAYAQTQRAARLTAEADRRMADERKAVALRATVLRRAL